MAGPFTPDQLERLRRLRRRFLDFEERLSRPASTYWKDEEDLALYDATFAERIGWKWDAVIGELRARGRIGPARTVLDWGCGTGIAARRFLESTGAVGVERVFVFDRDAGAREYAARRVRESHPAVAVDARLPGAPPDLLLLSHVLDELDDAALEPLLGLVRNAGAVIWVEPGSRVTSRRLSGVRESVRDTFEVLAPCTHAAACGALAAGREADWCHFFAAPPTEVFTDAGWAAFGRALGIDLRSLPYSFLALARPGTVDVRSGPSARLLGRPRVSRGRIDLCACEAGGLRDLHLLQRTDKALFKSLAGSPAVPALFDAATEGARIVTLRGHKV